MRAAVVTSLLFALVALSCAAAWMFAWRARNTIGERPVAPVRLEISSVPAASGERVLADGRRVSVRVTRLHTENARQRFDAEALRARFSLPEGEPFQCLVELHSGPEGAAGTGAFDLRDVVVADERGVALVPFPGMVEALPGLLVDPLAALVAPPNAPLPPEHRIGFVMWGRPPESSARFETCCERPVELRAADVSSRELSTSLARIRRELPANGEEHK